MDETKTPTTKVPRVVITGTKGKTTVTNIISQVFQALSYNVLQVDTTGHFVNGIRKSTLQDSKRVWGLVPSVAAGRYLYEFHVNPELATNGIAVLESSLGSTTTSGTACGSHNIGIFLNVFEDHIGSSSRITSKEDIVVAKSFVYRRIGINGVAVCNADDPYVVSALSYIPTHRDAQTYLFGLDTTSDVYEAHRAAGGVCITVEEGTVVLQQGDASRAIVSVTDVPWTFDGTFVPSVYNLLAVVAGCVAQFGVDNIPAEFGDILASTRLDLYGGRLTLLASADGVEILADYAHEKFSLTEVAKLAKSRTKDNGKVIGVVRMAYDRTDDVIRETGQYIADAYDHLIVYDKIDGYWRQPKERMHVKRFQQKIGHVSSVLGAGIQEKHTACDIILREDEALARAKEIAAPGDVIVHIVNDDIERSISFIQDVFGADFV